MVKPLQQRFHDFGPFRADAGRRLLLREGNIVPLTPKAFDILVVLIRNADRIVEKDELMRLVWPDTVVEENNLTRNISSLRKALEEGPTNRRFIVTVPGRGYQFAGELAVTVPESELVFERHARAQVQIEEIEEEDDQTLAVSQLENLKQPAWRYRARWLGLSFLILTAVALYLLPVPRPRVTGSTQLTNGSNYCCGLVTDGSRLYFRKNQPAGPSIAQVSVNGGDFSLLPTPIENVALMDISPDHSQLLVSQDVTLAPMWGVPLPAGSPRRIGNMEVEFASWFPNGEHLLLERDDALYIANPGGGDLKKIPATFPSKPSALSVSPDGTRIRFTLYGSDEEAKAASIWEVGTDGSNLHPLLPGWHSTYGFCCGRWTPDGRYYVFITLAGRGGGDLFSLPESRPFFRKSMHEPVRLTSGPFTFGDILVSVTGKQIFAYGLHQAGELVHYDPVSKQFVRFLGGISARDVAFSRDGKWIAYVTPQDNHLWRSRVDGNDRLQLTFGADHASLPRWSPDGKQIAYTSKADQKSWKIFLINADGGIPRALLPDSSDEGGPTWSADGTKLAFGIGWGTNTETPHLGVIDINTGSASTIPGSAKLFRPRWSPDGRYIAALSVETNKKLFLYDVQSQKWAVWIVDNDDIGWPSWTSDSHYVQYETGYSTQEIRRVRIGDTHPETLFSFVGLWTLDAGYGGWNDNAPDNSRMFLRDASNGEIYALDVDFP